LSLTLNEEHWPIVFENRVLRKILQPKSKEEKGGFRKLHYTELIYCIPLQILLGRSKKGRLDGRGMWYV
jgi:hypothetical protein